MELPRDVDPTDADYAAGRLPTRTYISRSFELSLGASRDVGHLSRYVRRVFDTPETGEGEPEEDDLDWTEHVVRESPGGRSQITLQVAREAGRVRKIRLDRVQKTAAGAQIDRLVELDRDDSARLIALIQELDAVPIEGQNTVLVDDELMQDLAADPDAVRRLYERDPERFRRLIESDVTAEDLIAVEYRRRELHEFRQLLENDDYFDEAAASAGGPEKVWQIFLERNPWVLGVGLSGQLLTSWDPDKLERTVAGHSVADHGKRVDAFMQTNGRLQNLAFAEIKHHRTALLEDKHYRVGCWPPSMELCGGATQAQQTVHLATKAIEERLPRLDEDGAETGEAAYLLQPRSYLVIGHLGELLGGGGGRHPDKHRSFELYRRNLASPQVITFDELLARAEWSVELAERPAD